MTSARQSGALIAIEGLDGSGKSTLARGLGQRLTETGFEVLSVSQPWKEGVAGLDLNRIVRARSLRCSPRTLALAFAANRTHQSSSVIEPWLEQSAAKVVVADRHIGSGLAYQMLDGIEADWLLSINNAVRFPDVVLFVDTPVDVCRARMKSRGRALELFESRLDGAGRKFGEAFDVLKGVGVAVGMLDGMQSETDLLEDAVSRLSDVLDEGTVGRPVPRRV